LGYAYALGGLGLGLNTVNVLLLPLAVTDLGLGLQAIALLLAIKAVAEMVVAMPAGFLIERIGARGTYRSGCLMICLGGTGMVAGDALSLLAASQVVLGLGRQLIWVSGQSYISQLRSGESRDRDVGRFSLVANSGQVVGPLLAGLVADRLDAQTAFGLLPAFGFIFVVLSIGAPPLPVAKASTTAPTKRSRRTVTLLHSAPMRVILWLTFARLWLPTVWTSFLSLFLVESGTPVSVAATALSVMALVAAASAAFTPYATRLGSPFTVTIVALIVSVTGVWLTPGATSVPAIYLPAVLVGLGQGLSLPLLILLVSRSVPDQDRTLALSLRSSVNQFAAMVAPLALAPTIALTTIGLGFGLAGGVALFTLIAAGLTQRRSTASRIGF
jgi:DHA1 family inner membrane transport protein